MRGLVVVLALAAGAARVDAQTAPPAQPPVPRPAAEFLPRFDYYVGLDYLVSDEQRFVWDANFGGDVDIVDYGSGRARFVANYETILGSEFRAFDPNQGDYVLDLSTSVRTHAIELAGVFHHKSRHLSDRPKRHPVDWNMVGGRILGGVTRGRTELRGRADLRGAVEHTFVDYRWELDTAVAAHVALRPGFAAVSSGRFQMLGVDGSRNRGTQVGYRGEGGVRIDGRGAKLELFVAVERRVDPYQLEFSTATWLTGGFRISSPAALRMP